MLLSLTSSMSGSEFMAQRKLAFQVLGSGWVTPSLYLPEEHKQGLSTPVVDRVCVCVCVCSSGPHLCEWPTA